MANLHTLQITAANTKSSPACNVFTSRSPATAYNSGDSSASCAHRLQHRTTCQLSTDFVAPVLFCITPRRGLRRQHRSFWYANCFPLVRERVYQAVAQKLVWYNRPSHYRCIASAIHATRFEYCLSIYVQIL
jgi:hypothetical protein